MITLKQKIDGVQTEIENIETKVIPNLQIDMDFLAESYKGAEDFEEELATLGKMDTVRQEINAEKRTVLLLQRRVRKLKVYQRPQRKSRRPCGRC